MKTTPSTTGRLSGLPAPDRSRGLPRAKSRGSLLIVAMIFAAVLGIAITSYIQLARTNLNVSSRAFYNNAGINLAETGLEEAMWSINQMVAGNASAWDGWSTSGNNAWRKWTGYAFDQNATGTVRVYVYNYNGASAPNLIARASVDVAQGTDIDKWIQVTLSKRSKFANGLVAKDSILFQGNTASVDSWNSDPDGDPTTAAIPYSSSVRRDNGSVGSISVDADAVLVQNADIWGYAATGGAMPYVGPQGLVGPFGTAAGTMNPDRISTDFSASFDPVTQPTGGTPIGPITSATTLGSAGATNVYSLSQISLSGAPGTTLTIRGKVTLYITATAGSSAISITGNGGISIEPGAELIVYTAGDIDIAGNGVLNGGSTASSANQPSSFQLWGTSTHATTKQNISIRGNGVLSGIVYAPNGSVDINGNGDVMGSVVANDITVTGNAAFHYDESLGNFDSGNPYGITRWRELTTASERSTYSSVLSF